LSGDEGFDDDEIGSNNIHGLGDPVVSVGRNCCTRELEDNAKVSDIGE
jgi:hypothetical protein